MYIYGFYKSSPDLFFDPASLVYRVASADSRAHLEKTTGRSLQTVLIGDLDRSDVQAYLLFRTTHPASDVKLAYGRTYVDGALAFVPYRLSHYRPPGKLQYGTNAMYGEGTSLPANALLHEDLRSLWRGDAQLRRMRRSPWLHTIGGGGGRRCARALNTRLSSPSDPRWYFVPILSVACLVFVSSDLDNVLFVLTQHALVPFLLLKLCSGKLLRPERAHGPSQNGPGGRTITRGRVLPLRVVVAALALATSRASRRST